MSTYTDRRRDGEVFVQMWLPSDLMEAVQAKYPLAPRAHAVRAFLEQKLRRQLSKTIPSSSACA